MVQKLTPFEEVLYEALVKAPNNTLRYDQLDRIEVPKKIASDPRNRFAVHMRTLRRKLGVTIKNVQGFGYKLVK